MAGSNVVSIEVLADVRNMVKGLGEANGSLNAIEGMAKKFGSTLAGLGIGIGIGAVLKDIFTTGVQEAKDGAAITAQFEAGIKSTGNAANLTATGMWDLADRISKYSGQTADSVAMTEQLLQTFTNIKNVGPDKIFDRATVASVDMAAKLGGTSSDNAIRLGKALQDPIKGTAMLTKVGVTFTDAQKKQIEAYMKANNVAAAQGVILDELQTEFGGAAEAAGGTWVGALNKAQNAFAEMCGVIVETFLPIVLPAIQWVGKALTDNQPAIQAFTAGLGKDIQAAITVSKPLLDGIVTVAKDIGQWITTSAVPAIQGLVQGWKDGTGPGGQFHQVFSDIWGVVKDIGNSLASLDLPGKFALLSYQWQLGTGFGGDLKQAAKDLMTGLTDLANFVTGTVVPAIKDASKWMVDHKDDLLAAAIAINIILIPAYLTMGVQAVANGAKVVGSWIASKIEAGISAAAQVIASYQTVAGWAASAAAAIASGAETVAIWLMLKGDAIAGAASVVASHASVVIGWGATAVAAVAAGATQLGVWIEQGVQAALGAAKAVGALVVVGAGWIASAAVAVASGVMMAAAWLVGLGPIGWIIAAVTLLIGAFVWAYNNIGWFHDGVNAVWHGIQVAFKAFIDFIVWQWNDTVYVFTHAPQMILDALSAIINDAKRIAGNVIDGVVNGVRDGLGKIGEVAKQIGETLWQAFKKSLGIASPSKVFSDLAAFAVDGAVQGITKNMDSLANAGGLMGDVLSASFTPQLTVPKINGSSGSYSGAYGPPQITINVSVPASANQVEIGREIKSALDTYYSASGGRS